MPIAFRREALSCLLVVFAATLVACPNNSGKECEDDSSAPTLTFSPAGPIALAAGTTSTEVTLQFNELQHVLALEDFRDVIDNGQQKILLGRKEMVEAATGGFRFLDDLIDPGLGVALAPKELGGGGDQACAGCGFARYQGISRRKLMN